MIESMGELLVHGIAMKPGKPTILGKVQEKPVFGLPGHPVAAYFVAKLFVLPLVGILMERTMTQYTVTAVLSESLSANQGRAQYQCCHLAQQDGQVIAYPIRSKSGLITTLAGADGYFSIARDCEGLPKGAQVQVVVSIGE
jgi:molybdopterin molybdotransferase